MILMFFKVYYFQNCKKTAFCEKIKDLACSFFNAHALINQGFIVCRFVQIFNQDKFQVTQSGLTLYQTIPGFYDPEIEAF